MHWLRCVGTLLLVGMASTVRLLALGSCENDGRWPYDDEDLFAIAIYTKIHVLDEDDSIMIQTREKKRVFSLRHSWLDGDRVVGCQKLRAYLYESCLPESVVPEIVSFYDEKQNSMPRCRSSATIPLIVLRALMEVPMGLFPAEAAVQGLLGFLSALHSRPPNNSSQKKLVPAAKWSIENLKKRVFDGSGDEECPICLEKFGEGVQVTVMNCSHAFHGDCIVRWLKTANSCPLCRSQLPTT